MQFYMFRKSKNIFILDELCSSYCVFPLKELRNTFGMRESKHIDRSQFGVKISKYSDEHKEDMAMIHGFEYKKVLVNVVCDNMVNIRLVNDDESFDEYCISGPFFIEWSN